MKLTLPLFASLLAFSPTLPAQRLIALDSSRTLWNVDMQTGARTQFGTVTSNTSTSAGLAYDRVNGILYLTSTGNDSLYTVDLTNGQATLIGAYGDSAIVMHGLEFDSSTNTLYGVSSHNNGLYNISVTTGAATLIGTSGLTSFSNLGYDSINDVMYSTNSGADSFYTMNRATGATTLIGPLTGPTNPNGLAFDSDTGTMYMVDNSQDNLYTINLSTGAATLIGSTGTGNLLGLLYLSGTGSITRNAHGCGPTTIQVTGHPGLGKVITTNLGGIVGTPFIGLDFSALNLPICTCVLGHPWGFSFGTSSLALPVPTTTLLLGATVLIQGIDVAGTGGCAFPQVTLTDTITVVIG